MEQYTEQIPVKRHIYAQKNELLFRINSIIARVQFIVNTKKSTINFDKAGQSPNTIHFHPKKRRIADKNQLIWPLTGGN
jgi:hypothetical protein